MVLEKTPESLLGCKEIKLVNPKGNQLWILIGRTDTEAEALMLWPPDAKSWHIGKDPDIGKDWRQKEKRVAEDGVMKKHHWLSGHEFEQSLEDSQGQESVGCCSPWGCRELHTTLQLNNNNLLCCHWDVIGAQGYVWYLKVCDFLLKKSLSVL